MSLTPGLYIYILNYHVVLMHSTLCFIAVISNASYIAIIPISPSHPLEPIWPKVKSLGVFFISPFTAVEMGGGKIHQFSGNKIPWEDGITGVFEQHACGKNTL